MERESIKKLQWYYYFSWWIFIWFLLFKSNLTNISNNLASGKGRIEDADFAAETTNLAKTQILQQASTAMLTQANAAKQNVLSLLQG